jgi:hypothetical protein
MILVNGEMEAMTNSNPTNLPFYKSLKSFADYKKAHLSKIYTYENENKDLIYFYFYRKQKSAYFTKNQLRELSSEHARHEEELKTEFKSLKLK